MGVSNLEETNNSENKMNPMLIGGIVVAILVVGAVVLFGMQGNTPEPATTPGESMMEEEEDAMMAENTIEVEGGAFYFEPNEIRVNAGEPVTIKLNSVDMMHDFVIDELDVQTEIIQGGNSGTVTFTPTEPGTYEFYCSVGNHRAQGMEGTLIVE